MAGGLSGLLDPWRFLFPYLWLFLAFEAARRRRRLRDAEAFLIGAAVGLLADGAFTKVLQDGLYFLGIDWLASLASVFDWGMISVVSLHVADAIWPRPVEPLPAEETSGILELVALAFIPAAAIAMYLFDAWVGRTRFQRMLGPAWLLADILFALAAAALYRRAAARAESEETERDPWLWALAALCAWLPGAQLFARAGGEWPNLLSVMYILAWTAGFGVWMWRLWRERGHASWEARHAVRAILALAAWRVIGALALLLVFGPVDQDPRSAAAFGFLVDLPSRLVFVTIFFASRLAV